MLFIKAVSVVYTECFSILFSREDGVEIDLIDQKISEAILKYKLGEVSGTCSQIIWRMGEGKGERRKPRLGWYLKFVFLVFCFEKRGGVEFIKWIATYKYCGVCTF